MQEQHYLFFIMLIQSEGNEEGTVYMEFTFFGEKHA